MKKIDNMQLQNIIIAFIVGLFGVAISMVVLNNHGLFQSIKLLQMIWLILNFIPFVIALYKNIGHEINYFVYYATVFLQWFLVTLFFLKIRNLMKIRKKCQESIAKKYGSDNVAK